MSRSPTLERRSTKILMINIEGLTKRYGRHTVVDNLSFRCGPGEVLGFLGPNGAGKSTTMKMVTGFVAPSAGTAGVCGHDIQTDTLAAQQCIGYLPEGAPLYAEMTPAQFLDFIADVRGLSGSARQKRLAEVVELLHLGPVLGQAIDTLSKGFKRRVGLAQAIVHDPEVLILDEPTDGEEKLIVISTHILEEVEAVCTRAIIIADGRLLVDDTPEALAAQGDGDLDAVFRHITQADMSASKVGAA
jgi:ABC-2 type transport system ATP-binding protein